MEQDTAHTALEQLMQLVAEHKDSDLAEIPISRKLLEQFSEEFHKATDHLQMMQEHLMQCEKMAFLGTLMAGIAHEISTPVSSINSNVDLFARSLEKIKASLSSDSMPEEVKGNRQITRTIGVLDTLNHSNQTACERILQIVRSLRSSVHGNMAEAREIDIHEELENALTLVHHELKSRIEVVKKYGELPKCTCFPSRINSVFINMLMNAAQAIENKGQITIETSITDNIISVKFTDTGQGIPPENLAKLFEPGFTTKSPDRGTGLGLSICKKIMEEHNGNIEVESEVGKGTAFTIRLPFG
ncbi:sensor histidine kinase [Candidatus Poribacteria bacterium]